jgi:modulator of FtsH protease HflK
MPWNNQSGGSGGGTGGGGWKGGGNGGGPWGQGPSGGKNQPPDLEDLLKRSQDKLKQVLPGGNGAGGLQGGFVFAVATALAAIVAFYAFTFRVNADEVGLVMRFGQFVRQEPPGLHFRLPYPIEEVRQPRVTEQRLIEVGFRSARGLGRSAAAAARPEESQMLTGDENIVDVDFVVFWKVDPKRIQDYEFNIQNPTQTVKDVAESAMREVVGQSNIQPILTEARQRIEQSVQKLIQDTLDGYKAGIHVDAVQMQKVDPPSQVIDAFRNVQAARADLETQKNKANEYANKVVPEARGEAQRILQGAEGYKQQTVAEATGQSSRFLKIYEEYKKSPEVTRKRMFLETMERVMSGTDKIILDNKGNGPGVTPFLPLDQLQRKKESAN